MMLGKLIDKRYQLVQVLGTGEFTQTYLAQDTGRAGRPLCVVKHFFSSESRDRYLLQAATRMFYREAEVLEQLGSHDQIPEFLACLEQHQQLYLVRDFVEGHPLSMELLSGYCWSEDQVIGLLQEMLGVLELLHSHGIIHLDIEPDHLIRQKQDGRIILVNFGSIKQPSRQATKQQGRAGAAEVTERSRPGDLYALGIIAIQALIGLDSAPLQPDSDPGDLLWHSQAQVSTHLREILEQMVSYQFHSPAEVLQALPPLANRDTQPEHALSTLMRLADPSQSSPSEQDNSSVFAGHPLFDDGSSPDSQTDDFDQTPLLVGVVVGTTTALALAVILCALWLLNFDSEVQERSVSLPIQDGELKEDDKAGDIRTSTKTTDA